MTTLDVRALHSARPAPDGDPERRAYFLHIPKTAGTTLDAFLCSMYRDCDVCPAQLWDALMATSSEELARYRFLHGHFGSALLSVVHDDPAVLTMLREPRARSISAFRHLRRDTVTRRRQVGPRYAELARESTDFAAFVRHPYARLLVENTQARYLAVTELPTEVLIGPSATDEAQTRFDLVPPPPDDELEERALERLRRCAWVGVAEHFGRSARLLAHTMRWSNPGELVSLNRSGSETPVDLSADDRDLLDELTRVDRVVYAAAKRMLDERWRDYVESESASWCARTLVQRARPLDAEVVFSPGDPQWGGGWWPREPDPDGEGWMAWTGPGTAAWLDLPIVLHPGARVEALIRMAMPGVTPEDTVFEVNGVALPVDAVAHPHGMIVGATVPETAVSAWTRVTIRTAGTARPGTGNERAPRGVAIGWVRLRPGA